MFFTSNKRVSKALATFFGALALVAVVLFITLSFGAPHAEALRCDPDDSECLAGLKACNDEDDNDGDGKIDYKSDGTGDPGCTSAIDNNEQNLACSDGIDNDGDGQTDYPADPGCVNATDSNEHGTAQCDDGIDNDSDLSTDYPTDLGCSSLTDTTELQPNRTLTVNIPAQEESFDSYARGQVTVSGQGTTCTSGACNYSIADGQTVTLTATALPTDSGGASFFTGWSGDCSGSSASVSIPMNWSKSCTANFHRHGAPYPTTHTLTIQNPGNGSGTVTFLSQGVTTTCTLTPSGLCSYTVTDDQLIHEIKANPGAGVSVSYPNPNESCFQDSNVFVQSARTCTVNFTLNAGPTCTASPQSVTPGQTVTFTGTGGTGAWSWASTGANPATSSNSSTFITSYATVGTKTATVTRGSMSSTCNVNVINTSDPKGTVRVQSNRNTNISITGPTPQARSAFTAGVTQNFDQSDPGAYSVIPDNIPDYTYVINPCGTTYCPQNLSAGGIISFDVVYTAIPTGAYCQASPATVPVDTNTTFTAYNMQPQYTWSFPGAYYVFAPISTSQSSYSVKYQNTGTYTATVTDSNGANKSCTVVVGTGNPPPPPSGLTMDFYVRSPQNNIIGSTEGPISIAYGTDIILEWNSTEVSPNGGCVASGDWSGTKTRNQFASETRSALTTPTPKTYTLRCYGFATEYGGSEPYIEKTITVNVATTSKGTINVVSNVPTTWSFTGPTAITPQTTPSTSGGPHIVDPGSYTIVPAALTGYTTPNPAYTAAQTVSAGGSITYTLTYTPLPEGGVDIKANGLDNPPAIVKGTTADISWTTENVEKGSCVASGGWSGTQDMEGTIQSGALNTNTTFTLTCTDSNDGTDVGDSVTVPVRDKQCGDGLDNDGDTRTDEDDPGCGAGDGDDDDEGNPWPECSDGLDNGDSEDTLSDANDPGCSTNGAYDPDDTDEANDGTVITECNDGLDNDGDGTIDDNDAGCANDSDSSELDEPDIREI